MLVQGLGILGVNGFESVIGQYGLGLGGGGRGGGGGGGGGGVNGFDRSVL